MIDFLAMRGDFDDVVGISIVLVVGFMYRWQRLRATARGVPGPAPAEQPGMGIRVGGTLVAWFADPDQAELWAQENFFGQWLGHPCTMPDRPPFTEEQLADARREGARLAAKIRPGRLLDE